MAVNIWEGAKADALIEAVANGQNGQKVDKQQGTNNAGKVLAIGSDGLVTPAYSIMPDAVKLALVNCFENVYWNTPDGEQYGKALKDALFSKSVDSRVIYEVPYGTDMRTLPLDTGVPVRNDMADEDFTILIKGTWVPNAEIGVLLDADAQNPSDASLVMAGIRIRSYVDSSGVHFRAAYKVGTADTPGHDATTNHNIIVVMRNFSRRLFINTYVDGVLSYSYNDAIASTGQMTGTYKVSAIHPVTGNSRAWTGTIDFYKIYKVALSDQEINELVGTNITA